jgi:hypothetical protein
MKRRYLVSTKKPGLEFEIIGKRVEDEVVTFTLMGANKVPFDRIISQDILDKYGYVVDIRTEPDAPPE